MSTANSAGYGEGREGEIEQHSSVVLATAAATQSATAWQQQRRSAGPGPANTTARATAAGQRAAERGVAEPGRGDRGQKA